MAGIPEKFVTQLRVFTRYTLSCHFSLSFAMSLMMMGAEKT